MTHNTEIHSLLQDEPRKYITVEQLQDELNDRDNVDDAHLWKLVEKARDALAFYRGIIEQVSEVGEEQNLGPVMVERIKRARAGGEDATALIKRFQTLLSEASGKGTWWDGIRVGIQSCIKELRPAPPALDTAARVRDEALIEQNKCIACKGSGEGEGGDCPCAECNGTGRWFGSINAPAWCSEYTRKVPLAAPSAWTDMAKRLVKAADNIDEVDRRFTQESDLLREAAALFLRRASIPTPTGRAEALEAVLKPFADVADQYSDSEDDHFQVLTDVDVLAPRLLLSHFRAARRALSSAPTQAVTVDDAAAIDRTVIAIREHILSRDEGFGKDRLAEPIEEEEREFVRIVRNALHPATKTTSDVMVDDAAKRRHTFVPDKKYPWFCGSCGYAESEPLQHAFPQRREE